MPELKSLRYPQGELVIPEDLKDLIPALLKAAQIVYDAWEQDAEGIDVEVGAGGICDRIADDLCCVLGSVGIDCRTVCNQGVGEQHAWVVAAAENGVWSIDIPAYVYERGGGYIWTKIPGIVFRAENLVFELLDEDPENLERYTD